MAINRTLRIEGEMKRALSEIFHAELKDPRMSDMATVTRVSVTQDLMYSKVYVSVYDASDKRTSTLEALKSAEGFIRSKLNDRIKIRRIPALEFVLDDSIEYGIRMSKLIDEVNAGIEHDSDDE